MLSSSVHDACGAETLAPGDPFGYDARWGYVLERETGLYCCQARYYDPGAGRWLTRDPIGSAGGIDVYGYCEGGPLGAADPSGLQLDKPVATAMLAAMAAGDEGPLEQAADKGLEALGGAAEGGWRRRRRGGWRGLQRRGASRRGGCGKWSS